jgi:hypothetical protein
MIVGNNRLRSVQVPEDTTYTVTTTLAVWQQKTKGLTRDQPTRKETYYCVMCTYFHSTLFPRS